MNKSGLVRRNGQVRPADFAAHMMAEAVDGAVEIVVSLMEDRKLRGLKIDPGMAVDVARAVDDRLSDAEGRVRLAAMEPWGGNGEGGSAEPGRRLEVLTALRSRAEALTSSQDRFRGRSRSPGR